MFNSFNKAHSFFSPEIDDKKENNFFCMKEFLCKRIFIKYKPTTIITSGVYIDHKGY
jgi:hypothetical protein